MKILLLLPILFIMILGVKYLDSRRECNGFYMWATDPGIIACLSGHIYLDTKGWCTPCKECPR